MNRPAGVKGGGDSGAADREETRARRRSTLRTTKSTFLLVTRGCLERLGTIILRKDSAILRWRSPGGSLSHPLESKLTCEVGVQGTDERGTSLTETVSAA